MSIFFKIEFEEKINEDKLKKFIKELENEKDKLPDEEAEVKTFHKVGKAKADPFQQILVAVIATLVAGYIKEKSPEAKEYTKRLIKRLFSKAKLFSNKVKVVMMEGKKEISFESDSEKEINLKLKIPT